MLFDGQRAYTYDAQNRVVSIYNVCSQGITEFAYGPLGEQIAETKDGVTIYHIYVGADVIAEYAANGDRLREYLDGPAGKLAMVDYTSAGSESAGDPEVFFYLIGHLGSVVALTDTDGNVVERYSYEPYGQTIITDATGAPRSASAYGNPYAWTGQRYDADNQLYHFYFRTYSPHLGRWLQRDPLGYVDGISQYEYVISNPLAYSDWVGLAPDTNYWFENPEKSLPATLKGPSAWERSWRRLSRIPLPGDPPGPNNAPSPNPMFIPFKAPQDGVGDRQ